MNNVSTKPYLVRAIYEWCVDQGYTPHIAVLVDERTRVPAGYARDGQIVLNLGVDATNQLVLGNDVITFQARFGGAAHALSIPVSNVIAIYARENGQGMAFEAEPESGGESVDDDASADVAGADEIPDATDRADAEGAPRTPSERGSHLKRVK
jgi:stringent starvation protein B